MSAALSATTLPIQRMIAEKMPVSDCGSRMRKMVRTLPTPIAVEASRYSFGTARSEFSTVLTTVGRHMMDIVSTPASRVYPLPNICVCTNSV